ncbi:MAG: hypothetical protein ACXWDT_01705 [Solirubrobacterales bacterium]
MEREASNLAERVLDRERRLQAAVQRLGHDESIEASGAINSLGRRLEELHSQARAQATRIRMRALNDAVQIAERVTELSRVRDVLEGAGLWPDAADALEPRSPAPEPAAPAPVPATPRQGNLFDGEVEVEIGPLADFAQLSDFEDAANAIGAAGEIEVKRFSGGRATLQMSLDQPVELLRELEERSALEFKVRSTKGDRVVLDVDEDEAAAA